MVRRTLLALLAFVSLASPLRAAPGARPLRTWCMDGWAGELCFDVLTFAIVEGPDDYLPQFIVGGRWGGAGFPSGQLDRFGRGPAMCLGLMGIGCAGGFLNSTLTWTDHGPVWVSGPDERAITISQSSWVDYDVVSLGTPCPGDACIDDPSEDEAVVFAIAENLDDVSRISFSLPRTHEVNGPIDQAGCYMPGWDDGYRIPEYDQTCRVVTVPEPGSLLLLATGLFGVAYLPRRRPA